MRKRRPGIRNGDCVKLLDGRIGRVRAKTGGSYRVRVRRASSNTHQFVIIAASAIKPIACPRGWMSPDGYRRYLRVTLAKMRQRSKR